MARDPSYIPALDPEAVTLVKRAAAPEPEAKVALVQPNIVEERQTLPSILPVIGGGLCKFEPTLVSGTLCACS